MLQWLNMASSKWTWPGTTSSISVHEVLVETADLLTLIQMQTSSEPFLGEEVLVTQPLKTRLTIASLTPEPLWTSPEVT